jgi:hypothetical protein
MVIDVAEFYSAPRVIVKLPPNGNNKDDWELYGDKLKFEVQDKDDTGRYILILTLPYMQNEGKPR